MTEKTKLTELRTGRFPLIDDYYDSLESVACSKILLAGRLKMSPSLQSYFDFRVDSRFALLAFLNQSFKSNFGKAEPSVASTQLSEVVITQRFLEKEFLVSKKRVLVGYSLVACGAAGIDFLAMMKALATKHEQVGDAKPLSNIALVGAKFASNLRADSLVGACALYCKYATDDKIASKMGVIVT